jgi:hypothetical protein
MICSLTCLFPWIDTSDDDCPVEDVSTAKTQASKDSQLQQYFSHGSQSDDSCHSDTDLINSRHGLLASPVKAPLPMSPDGSIKRQLSGDQQKPFQDFDVDPSIYVNTSSPDSVRTFALAIDSPTSNSFNLPRSSFKSIADTIDNDRKLLLEDPVMAFKKKYLRVSEKSAFTRREKVISAPWQ